ncbi:hypothetical protein MTO96_034763 [Rhipicephalus appendiculatus]
MFTTKPYRRDSGVTLSLRRALSRNSKIPPVSRKNRANVQDKSLSSQRIQLSPGSQPQTSTKRWPAADKCLRPLSTSRQPTTDQSLLARHRMKGYHTWRH